MVDCTSLENWQRETVREFESHRLRQINAQRVPKYSVTALSSNLPVTLMKLIQANLADPGCFGYA